MSLTLSTGECAALFACLDVAFYQRDDISPDFAKVRSDLLPRLKRAATPRSGNAAGKRVERRIASELREIVASLPGEWKVARNQTDRQKGQVADGSGEYTIEGPRRFPWTFELKDGSGFRLQHLLTDPVPSPLASTAKREGFWAQAARQAQVVDRFPILIVREPSKNDFEFAVLRPVHRAMLVELTDVRATIALEGERLDVCLWRTVRAAPAARWLIPPCL